MPNLDEVMQEALTEPIDPQAMDWRAEHDWQQYVEKRDARLAWTKAYDQTRGDWIKNPEWIELRYEEECALNWYYRGHLEQIAKRTVKRLQTDNHRSLRKQYGKASTTIHELRQDIAAMQGRWKEAKEACECGAFKKAHFDSPPEELRRKNKELEARLRYSYMRAERWETKYKELKNGEADQG